MPCHTVQPSLYTHKKPYDNSLPPQQAKPLHKRYTTRFHCLPKAHKVNRHKHECAIYGAEPVWHVIGCHKCTPRKSSGCTQQTTPGKLTYQTLECIKQYSPGAITCTIWKLNHIKLTNMCPCCSRSGSATCAWHTKRKTKLPCLGTHSMDITPFLMHNINWTRTVGGTNLAAKLKF